MDIFKLFNIKKNKLNKKITVLLIPKIPGGRVAINHVDIINHNKT